MTEDNKRENAAFVAYALEMNYLRGYLGQLVGAKVTGIQVSLLNDEEDDDPLYAQVWPSIIFEKDGVEYVCELSKDEEGNGPGFMFGLRHVSNSEEFMNTVTSLSNLDLKKMVLLLSERFNEEPTYTDKNSVEGKSE